MKIKWGNIFVFLLIMVGVVGYFEWPTVQGWLGGMAGKVKSAGVAPSAPSSSSTPSTPANPDAVVFARDTWITGGIPELGLARGYQRDYRLTLSQSYYESDTDRLEAVATGKAQVSEMSFPALLYNLQNVGKGKYADQISILGIIDYSRGGDGIVVRSGIKTVNDLMGKRVGYLNDGTGKYMISFLLRMVDMRFEDVKGLPYKDEASLVADFGAGKLDAIAYWQPGINEVLKKVNGSKVLLSTADMPTLIPDVLIANRQFVATHGDKAEAFMKFWFATVKHVLEHPDQAYATWADKLNAATAADGPIYGTDNTAESLKAIFSQEVRLTGFDENLKLMGVSTPADFAAMTKFAVDNWNRVEDLKSPNVDILFNNRVITGMKDDVTLKVAAIDPSKTGNTPAAQPQEQPKQFAQNADPGKLDEVAQISIPNIEFDPDATSITAKGKDVIEKLLVPLAKQFPNFYLLIDGHTDVGGDPAVLLRLSQGRADSVKKELVARGFPENQIITRGFGDTKPLFKTPKTEDEKAKNRRTEFRLLRDPATN